MTPREINAILLASKFVDWYRRMKFEGQITTTMYAVNLKPVDDYDTMKALDDVIREFTTSPNLFKLPDAVPEGKEQP